MLIKITTQCSNECTHCMNDAKCDGKHMSLETFGQAIAFSSKYDCSNADILTGGEPTEHPQFLEFVHLICSTGKMVTVTTNGHWIVEHPQETEALLTKYPNLYFQVTYDSRYYQKKLDITKRALRHKRIMLETSLRHIYPQGRAKTNNIPYQTKCPKCTNLQLIAKQLKMRDDYSLSSLIKTLREHMFFCTPSIFYDGGLAFGESDLCPKKVSIFDSEPDIILAIWNHECDGCPEAKEQLSKLWGC